MRVEPQPGRPVRKDHIRDTALLNQRRYRIRRRARHCRGSRADHAGMRVDVAETADTKFCHLLHAKLRDKLTKFCLSFPHIGKRELLCGAGIRINRALLVIDGSLSCNLRSIQLNYLCFLNPDLNTVLLHREMIHRIPSACSGRKFFHRRIQRKKIF